jgi:hypothetical protein
MVSDLLFPARNPIIRFFRLFSCAIIFLIPAGKQAKSGLWRIPCVIELNKKDDALNEGKVPRPPGLPLRCAIVLLLPYHVLS